MSIELVVVEPGECVPLRHALLHASEPVEAARYGADAGEGAMHLALKDDDAVLAVVSLLPERRGGRGEMWRLRGLAVAPEHQGTGLGSKLVKAVATIAGERGGGLWCEPPAGARGFLEGRGFGAPEGSEGAGREAGQSAAGTGSLTWQGA